MKVVSMSDGSEMNNVLKGFHLIEGYGVLVRQNTSKEGLGGVERE